MKQTLRWGWVLGLAFAVSACSGTDGAQAPMASATDLPVQSAVSGDCPQKRKTMQAPSAFLKRTNPLEPTAENLKRGETLYQQTAKPMACKTCHGETGNGRGDPDFASTPPARNFTCNAQMNAIPDGQLFWVIRNGSAGTVMPAHSDLSENEIWQLILYIRGFSGT